MTPRERELPQLRGGHYLTDRGFETVVIFQDGIELPQFAAFTLLRGEGCIERPRRYYRRYVDSAVCRERSGFILEDPPGGAKLDAPAYDMINCAHPAHFESTLGQRGDCERDCSTSLFSVGPVIRIISLRSSVRDRCGAAPGLRGLRLRAPHVWCLM